MISFHCGRKPDTTRGSARTLRYSCVKVFDLVVRRETRSIKTSRCFCCSSVSSCAELVCGGLYGPNGLLAAGGGPASATEATAISAATRGTDVAIAAVEVDDAEDLGATALSVSSCFANNWFIA